MRVTKASIHALLDDPHARFSPLVNKILLVATFVSILLAIFEIIPDTYTTVHTVFRLLNVVTVLIFTIEYLARLWSTPQRHTYVFSFIGAIDLASILPFYLGFGNFTLLKTFRLARTMRLLRLGTSLNTLKRHAQKTSERTK